jgi:TPR repeat protein
MRRAMWALLLAACSPPPPPAASPDAALIEPSEPEEESLGQDNDAALACFERARAAGDARAVDRCRARDVPACNDVAKALRPDAEDCAGVIWELACENHDAPSCGALGDMLLAKNEGAARGRRLLEKACEGGVGASCTHRGILRLLELADAPSNEEAVADLERGCSLGDAEGCLRAAAEQGDMNRAPNDLAKAAELLERSCELGSNAGCLQLGQAFLYASLGVAYDPVRGLEVLRRLCDSATGPEAAEACYTAWQQLDASGNAPPEAHGYLVKACDNEHDNACSQLAVELYTSAKYTEAIALSTKLIEHQPDNWLPRYTRGMSLFDTAQHQEAITDLEVLCDQRQDWYHCELWLYAAQQRSGGDGRPRLASANARVAQVWPQPVFDFFLGKKTATSLLAAAKNPDPRITTEQECEAYYYIGQSLLIRGKKKDAAAMFKKSVATQVTNFIEYEGSQAELSRLEPPAP